jgi:hypothetical protein
MKTKVTTVKSSGEGIAEALRQTELVAKSYDLSSKETLQLRLLAEEMTGMLSAIAGDVTADYWLEEENGRFSLHLSADTKMYIDKRNQLIALSTSGKNEASTGFMGKIRSLLDTLATPESEGLPSSLDLGMSPVMDGGNANWMWHSMATWSMEAYKEALEKRKETEEEAKEAWDELEKSIVANLADEVKVAVRGDNVELVIDKSF